MTNKFDFEFELSHSSISKLTNTIQEYRKELVNSKKYILEALAKYTQERVVKHLGASVGAGNYPATDNLINNIKITEIIDDMVRVVADTEYAKYVEYGTGLNGSDEPHPMAGQVGWQYSKGPRIYEDKNTGRTWEVDGWYYVGSDGNVYYTEGLEAHNFMYNAWLDLKEHYREIMKQVLRERGLI